MILIGWLRTQVLFKYELWALVGAYNMFHITAVHAVLFPAPLASRV